MKEATSIDDNYIKLENVNDEDLGDFIYDIGKSFGIKFNDSDFQDVNTYGELCDVILSKLDHCEDVLDCTSQQAFYKLRGALAKTLNLDKSGIKSDTRLDTLITRDERVATVATLIDNLGFKVQFLMPPTWYTILNILMGIGSLAAFFFSWKLAISGILLSIIMGKVGIWFGKEFQEDTVGEFVRYIMRKHYRNSRRKGDSVNKAEIIMLLDERMIELFDLDRASLTRDAKFNWAKKK